MAKSFKFDGLLKAAEKQKEEADKKKHQDENIEPAKTEAVKVDPAILDRIVIREEFKNLIPPLAWDEYEKLKDNILEEGCRDALILWKDGNEYVLIDGHNRYQICSENDLDFKVEIKEFSGEEAVSDWMVNNQLGKRNVSEETKSYLRGLQYSREKGKVGGTGANQYSEQKGQSVPTALRLAEQHKVSDKTIKRDELYARAIDKISDGNKELKWSILNKKIPLPKIATIKLADEDERITRRIGHFLLEGKSFNQALKEVRQADKKQEKEDPHRVYVRNLKAGILNCLNEAIRNKNLEALQELRELLRELEQALED